MIRAATAALAAAVVFAVASYICGCALFKSPAAKAVVDLAFAECVQRADSMDANVVAALCGAGPELYDILTRLLAAKRTGLARQLAKPGVCREPAP